MFIYNDGGRAAAGFRGDAGDCVTRALAIATGRPYAEVYADMAEINLKARRMRKGVAGHRSARNGVHTDRKPFRDYLTTRGWRFVPTMGIGTGCRVHLTASELPSGTIIARVSHHLVTVIDGTIHDTFDCSRGGARCVYGYWTLNP